MTLGVKAQASLSYLDPLFPPLSLPLILSALATPPPHWPLMCQAGSLLQAFVLAVPSPWKPASPRILKVHILTSSRSLLTIYLLRCPAFPGHSP